jgi:hypothetical protein
VGWLASLQGAYFDSMAPELWALGPKLVVVATLVAGTCLVRLAAGVIDRNGVGSGLVLVAAAELLLEVGHAAFGQLALLRDEALSPAHVVVTLALFAVPAVITWRLVMVRSLPVHAAFVVRPSAGIVPATVACALPPLAVTIASFTGAVSIEDTTMTLIGALIAAALVPLCSSIWASPARAALLRARMDGRSAADADDLAQARSEAADARLPTWLMNGALVLAFAIATLWLPYGFNSILAIVVLAAAVRDVEAELRARRAAAAPLVSVGEVHRLDVVNPLLALLAREKIDATLRGAHVRALSHFFAPWIAVEILVDTKDAEHARSIVRSAITRCVEADPSRPR